jgi:hypothetical protein
MFGGHDHLKANDSDHILTDKRRRSELKTRIRVRVCESASAYYAGLEITQARDSGSHQHCRS